MQKTLNHRKKTKKIMIGKISCGGNSPIIVQSMLSRPATDIAGSAKQAAALEKAGCGMIRAAIPDLDAVRLIPALKSAVTVPVVADIHFDYRLALESVAAGVDKIRINPGNIGSADKVKAVAKACASAHVPIRIGVNSGSLEREILAKHGGVTAEGLRDSALFHISLLEQFDFTDIIVSIKSPHVPLMVEAYRLVAGCVDYPLHLGVTESGTERMGIIKSTAGIASLLLDGIGDTIRVSLTADPLREVEAGFDILRALELYSGGVSMISCPTCGRTKIDLIELANKAESMLKDCNKNITVAIMGCIVNGPGEAKDADVGIAGGDGCGIIFRKGEIIRKVPEEKLLDELMKEIELV